jgi:large subunit ribosomal protein L25
MKQVPLSAKVRTIRGSSKTRLLRSEGLVPAEVYGHKDSNQSIAVSAKELNKILVSSRGENIFFSLAIDGQAGEPMLAVLKELQYDKVSNSVIHADFHKVKMNEKIRIKIPVRVLNPDTCEGVKLGGVLQTFMRTVEVQCLPSQIPEAIQVDAAHLNVGDAVHVSDLKLPEGVKTLESAANVIVSVAAQMAEEVKAEAAPAEGAVAAAGTGEPEVITAKKKEEGAVEGKADAKAPAGKADAKAPAGKTDAKAAPAKTDKK